MDLCYSKAERKIGRVFESYGRLVNRNPVAAILFAVLLNGFLGINVKWMQTETDFQRLYTPSNTQADIDAIKIKSMLPDDFNQNFYYHQQVDEGLYGSVLFNADENIFSENYRSAFSDFNDRVLGLKVKDNDGFLYTYKDICIKNSGSCYTLGSVYLDDDFWKDLLAKNVTYPEYEQNQNYRHRMDRIFGNVENQNGIMKSAKSFLMKYYLRKDTDELRALSLAWENEFIKQMSIFRANETAVFLSSSQSLAKEVVNNTVWDEVWFVLVFLIMTTCAVFSTAGGNCLTQRGHLGIVGVLSSGLAILGAYGLCAAAEVKYENLVSIMPFLVLGIGLSNTFVLLSGLTDAPLRGTVEERIGHAMRTCGVSITISSLTDFIVFMFGFMSELVSIQNFCTYTGIAVVLSYINQITFVLACAVLHERRIADSRHCCTCRRVYSPEEMKSAGYRNKLTYICCSGVPAESKEGLQSFSEKLPARGLAKVLMNIPMKVIIILIYLGYVGISIFGVMNIDQDFQMQNTLREDSYMYKFDKAYQESFPNAVIVSLNVDGTYDYEESSVFNKLIRMTETVKRNKHFDQDFEVNWLKEYSNQGFPFNISKVEFNKQVHLFTDRNPMYKNDIVFNGNETQIIWSRIFVLANRIKNSREKGEMIEEVRKLLDESSLNVFAYGTNFAYFEQYISVLTKTMQTVGISYAVSVIVVSILLTHPFMIFLVVLSVASILLGVFGFMTFWQIDLNSFTMAYLTISVGVSVNYCVYMCYSFMKSHGTDRKFRAYITMQRMVGPILNSAIYFILGICILLFSKSYIFISFFKIVFLVISFGIFHSIFVLPVILSLIGPGQTESVSRQTSISKKPLFPNRPSASWSVHTGVNAFDDIFYGKKTQNKRSFY